MVKKSKLAKAVERAKSSAAADSAPEFFCSLGSDGGFYMRSGAAEMNLPREQTRQLFHYLDMLFATEGGKRLEQLQ